MDERTHARASWKKLGWVALVFVVLAGWWYAEFLTSIVRPSLIRTELISAPQTTELQAPAFAYPTLGIVAPVVEAAQTSPLAARDWQAIAAALRAGVSLAYEGPSLESARLAFVTGHSSDTVRHPYASVFAGLGQSRMGDEFVMQLANGQRRYRVSDRSVYSPADLDAFRALEPAPGSPQRVILVTCWPPLTTKSRLVVTGEYLGGE